MDTFLSCAMIVRDAAATLDHALCSVAPWVDELVILDTGSVDDTVKIAKRHTHSVYQGQWHDSFAQARQRAHDLCHGEWVLHLDADDELIGGKELRQAVDAAPRETAALLLKYVTEWDKEGKPIFEFWRERVTRRLGFKWEGRVHEVLVPAGSVQYERFYGAWVKHCGHGDGTPSLHRNIRLLRMEYADNPKDPRTLFYLGRDLLIVGELEEGMQLLERYLPLSTWLDEAHAACLLMGDALRRQQKYREAYQSDLRMLNYQPLWPQTYFALAEDCYYLKAWDACLHFSRIGESLPMPQTNLFLNERAIKTSWMIYRVVALHQMGRIEEARELTERAVSILPDDAMHAANLAFYRKHHNPAQVDLQEAIAVG